MGTVLYTVRTNRSYHSCCGTLITPLDNMRQLPSPRDVKTHFASSELGLRDCSKHVRTLAFSQPRKRVANVPVLVLTRHSRSCSPRNTTGNGSQNPRPWLRHSSISVTSRKFARYPREVWNQHSQRAGYVCQLSPFASC